MSFASLGLSEALVRAVGEAGYTQPTPIQAQAIPVVLSGADLMGGAQTGTGKTAAFVLPLLQRLATLPAPGTGAKGRARPIRALILAPTRELAAQVEESVRTYGKHSGARSAAIFGGVSINPQIDLLRRGVDILVATPGRLLDHAGQRTVDLSAVQILVLDEADRMLDMGFIPDIRRILALLPKQRQNLLFSATFSDPIRALADTLLHAPVSIQVTPRNSTVDAVAQKVHPVDSGRKAELLVHLIKEGNWFQVLVFTRTKHGANKLAQRLDKSGITALAIHGNKSQNARTRALAEFKSARLQVLVATDIAARGLDIEQLPHVVNFDLPHVPEDYVHRIGRTGRAGATGEAVSLVSADEMGLLRDIERLIRRALPRAQVAGYEPGTGARNQAETLDARPPRAPGRGQRPAARSAPGRTRARGAAGDESHATHAQRPARGHANAPGKRPEASRTGAQGATRGPGAAERAGAHAPARRGAAPEPARAQGAPRGGAATSNFALDRGTARKGGRPEAQASALVRSNLPPGWSVPGAGQRRGR